jgi:glycosyl transferase family 25
MKCFIINLPEKTERRDLVDDALKETGLEYEFFAAVRGKDGMRYFDRVSKMKFLAETTREPTPNEFGCYASHLELWKKCKALGQPVLILEDDIIPSPALTAEVVTLLPELARKFGFIRLEPHEDKMHLIRQSRRLPPERVAEFDGYSIYTQFHPFLRTSAYVISPNVASAFIESSKVLRGPVDHFFRMTWIHRQALFLMSPPPFLLSDISIDSSIDGRIKKGNIFRRRYIRFVRRIYRTLATKRAHRVYASHKSLIKSLRSKALDT